MRSLKFITMVLFFTGTIFSCKKDASDQLSGDVKELGRGAYLTLDKANKVWVDPTKTATETVSFEVSGYGDPIDSIVTYISLDGSTDKAQWRRVKSTVMGENQKATVTVQVAVVLSGLGIAPASYGAGDEITLFNEVVTKDKKRFSIANTAAEFESNSNYRQAARVVLIATGPVDFSKIEGDYEVIVDQWVDYFPGDPIYVSANAAARTITIEDWPYVRTNFASSNRYDMTLTVDPNNGIATRAKQVAGSYSNGGTVYSVETIGNNNFVISEAGIITLIINITSPVADQGNYRLRLRKF
jgi:hypothetical protein